MQLNFDFSRRIPPPEGKKTERLTVPCSTEFKEFLQKLAAMQQVTVAELLYRYALDGMREDLSKVFLTFPHLDKKLRDVL